MARDGKGGEPMATAVKTNDVGEGTGDGGGGGSERSAIASLKPGEVLFLGTCDQNPEVKHYARRTDEGELEVGCTAPMGSPMSGGAAGAWTFETPRDGDHPNLRRIKENIRYTARGPSCVSNDSYRLGWDQTFGKKVVN